MPLPREPLDYGNAQARLAADSSMPPRRVFSIGRFIITTAVMLILLVIFLFIVPGLTRAYQDFGSDLPAVTRAMMNISRFMQTPGGWVFGILIAGSVGVLVGTLPIRGRWLRLLLVLIFALIVIGFALAVLLPILNMMESLTSNPAKL